MPLGGSGKVGKILLARVERIRKTRRYCDDPLGRFFFFFNIPGAIDETLGNYSGNRNLEIGFSFFCLICSRNSFYWKNSALMPFEQNLITKKDPSLFK